MWCKPACSCRTNPVNTRAFTCLSIHAAHAAGHVAGLGCGLGCRLLGDEGLGRQNHAGHARGVLQRAAGHLGGIDDAAGDHVAVLLLVGVEAIAVFAGGADLLQNDGAVEARVGRDLADGLLERLGHDTHARLLIAVDLVEQRGDSGDDVDEDRTAAGDDALFHGGLRRVQSILDAQLLLLHLHLGGSSNLDDSHAAGQLGQTLLQLLTVVIGVGVLDLSADLGHASVDVFLGASALNDGGLVLGDDDLLGVAEHGGVDRSGWPYPAAWPCDGRQSPGP